MVSRLVWSRVPSAFAVSITDRKRPDSQIDLQFSLITYPIRQTIVLFLRGSILVDHMVSWLVCFRVPTAFCGLGSEFETGRERQDGNLELDTFLCYIFNSTNDGPSMAESGSVLYLRWTIFNAFCGLDCRPRAQDGCFESKFPFNTCLARRMLVSPWLKMVGCGIRTAHF